MNENKANLTSHESLLDESAIVGEDSLDDSLMAPSGLPRFGLSALFYATAVVAAAVAFIGPWGIGWAIVVCMFWIKRDAEIKNGRQPKAKNPKYRPNAQSGFTAIELVIVVVVIGLLIGMLLPAVTRMGPYGSARIKNSNRMRQLILAMHNYESAYKNFPPAYVADEDGKPMHSWRVLILPFLEENDVFDRYDFDEPWDGPNNSKLVDQLKDDSLFFQNENQQKNFATGFKLVTGPETAFDKDQSASFGAITAGSSNTIGLVDDTTRPVNWMSPEDVAIDQAVGLFDAVKNPQTGAHQLIAKFSKRTFYFSNVGFMDGSVLRAGTLDDPAEIRDYFLIKNISEKVFDDLDFQDREVVVEARWGAYALLALNVLLAVLPAFWIKGSAKQSKRFCF